MILPLLFVPLVFGMSSTPDAMAVPPDTHAAGNCESTGSAHGIEFLWCCWTETDPADPEQIEINRCQSCQIIDNSKVICDPPVPDPSAPPTTGENIVPGVTGGLEQPPTFSPFDPTAPQGGVLEQLPDQPPLFGRNEASVPPTGGIVQPFTSTTPPLFGNIPQGGGFGVLQEPETPPTFGQVAPLVQKPTTETPPTPLPTPPPPDFTPQDNQGGGLPTIENQENVPPGGGVAEQPEDDGEQEDPAEGAETAGPLT
jgi:hypothetical protein